MGFADLSIADIAAEYDLTDSDVFALCTRLGIVYQDRQTNLALEDAKAIISLILSERSGLTAREREISS